MIPFNSCSGVCFLVLGMEDAAEASFQRFRRLDSFAVFGKLGIFVMLLDGGVGVGATGIAFRASTLSPNLVFPETLPSRLVASPATTALGCASDPPDPSSLLRLIVAPPTASDEMEGSRSITSLLTRVHWPDGREPVT